MRLDWHTQRITNNWDAGKPGMLRNGMEQNGMELEVIDAQYVDAGHAARN